MKHELVLTEEDLIDFKITSERLDKLTKKYDSLREKILAVAANEKRKMLRRETMVAVIKDEERRRVDFKAVLIKMKGEKYVDRLVRKAKPQIIKKVTVVAA